MRKHTASKGKITAEGKYRGPSPVIMPRFPPAVLAPFLRDPKLLPKKPPTKNKDAELEEP